MALLRAMVSMRNLLYNHAAPIGNHPSITYFVYFVPFDIIILRLPRLHLRKGKDSLYATPNTGRRLKTVPNCIHTVKIS